MKNLFGEEEKQEEWVEEPGLSRESLLFITDGGILRRRHDEALLEIIRQEDERFMRVINKIMRGSSNEKSIW